MADDDAGAIALFHPWEWPPALCFDHNRILQDYWHYRHYGYRPHPAIAAPGDSSPGEPTG